ncbi:hypothetical protein D3C76_1508500 [compost metagenome]
MIVVKASWPVGTAATAELEARKTCNGLNRSSLPAAAPIINRLPHKPSRSELAPNR